MTPATLIRRARADSGLTQAELANRAGTSQPAVARYESGAGVPTIPTLERLLAACGRSLKLSAGRRTETPTSIRGQVGEQAAALRRERPRLLAAAARRGMSNVRVFGSVARGDARPDSDIDLLIELKPGRTLIDLAGFRHDATRILGHDVDVATPSILRDEFRDEVLSQAVLL